MPRKAKTHSGAPAQPVGAVAGQNYGAGQAQMELQRQLPAPQSAQPEAAAPALAPAQPAPAPGQAAPQSAQIPPEAQLAQAVQAMKMNGGVLANGPQMNVPVTHGLKVGPGAGPEAMIDQAASPAARMLNAISDATGDPYFRDLLRKNGMA